MTGVSFVIPVRNGAAWIRDTITSVHAQEGGPREIIAVEDGSTDGSLEILQHLEEQIGCIVVHGERRGAAAALNAGLRAARFPIICQVDQDVVLEAGWMNALVERLKEPGVAAVQGLYVTDSRAPLLARVMSRDLEERYAAVPAETDHVCTGNTAYRAEALIRVGGFDEALGYGYDNDLSYRLRAAGYRLLFCREARSIHRWREGLRGYFRQQYGFGYGRLDLLAKHPHRVGGDDVSPALMMSHPIVLLFAAFTLVVGFMSPVWTSTLLTLAAVLVGGLSIERTVAGMRAARRFGDATPLWFPVVHLVRDAAWVTAIVIWTVRRLVGTRGAPAHSMQPRQTEALPFVSAVTVPAEASAATLVVIPAFNEALNIEAVVREIESHHPRLAILVVDDGSTDGTWDIVSRLGVRRVRLPQQMGVGAAIRVGLRYARRQGFDMVVRLDGDGQHRPDDIPRLLHPLLAGRADVTLGSRGPAVRGTRQNVAGLLKRPLAACLSVLTGQHVTDPTCGLCAMGPRAVHVLAERHPTGYPEPELRLFLSRTALRVVNVSVADRRRLNGRTSLTPIRMLGAAARVGLAMCVVPFRPVETEPAGD